MRNLKAPNLLVLAFLFLSSSAFAVNKNAVKETFTTTLDVKEIFLASPVIYSILIILSVIAVSLCAFCLMTFRAKNNISEQMVKDVKTYLLNKEYEKAINYCNCQENLFANIISSALSVRSHGPQFVAETMKAEGQRYTTKFWQKIGLLNEIVVIAPMLGLLGTVLGMFYAFYDINRSIDSISSLFDGLGIAVGTTVAGLIVAILSMMFHTILKYRLIK
ncbi:MAG: MotA/TolQ/ExbB proton channel family protein, partial [Parachlamydiales bacterium]